MALLDPTKAFSGSKLDVNAYLSNLLEHTHEVEELIRHAKKGSSELAKKHIQDHLTDLTNELYKNVRLDVAKVVEPDNQGEFLSEEHYKKPLQSNPEAVTALKRSLLTHKTTLLDKIGHTDFTGVNPHDLQGEELDFYLSTAARDFSRYFGPVRTQDGVLNMSTIVQEHLLNQGDEATHEQVYDKLQTYLTNASKMLPEHVHNFALQSAQQKVDDLPFQKRLDTIKSTATNLNLPIKQSAPDSLYDSLSIQGMNKLYTLNEEGQLTQDVLDKIGLSSYSQHLDI